MKRCAVLLFGIFASVINAQEPPDFLSLIEKAERYAYAAASTPMCRKLGFADRSEALMHYGQELIDSAEREGMAGQQADALLTGPMNAEFERQKARMSAVDKTDQPSIDRFLDYWEKRCADLEADPVYGRFFHR